MSLKVVFEFSKMAAPIQYGQYRVPPADEMVNFGVGQPAPSMLPLKMVREATAQKLAEEDPLYLQYGYISGYPLFRQSLARFLEEGYGKPVDPELLFTTNGVSGALGLICSLFVGRGDTIICENPSYFLALSIFRDFGLNIIPVDMDENGLKTDDLEKLLESNPALKPKFVYTIPAFHNPTGYSLSHERKQHLVRMAAKYDFMVLADEVYQLLGFDGVPRPADALCYYDTVETAGAGAGHVISIGSFAKILAPGMRLGWLQTSKAAEPLLKKIYNCGQLDSSGALNPVISGIVHTMIDNGMQKTHLAAVRAELTKRASVLGDALRAHLPEGASFIQPSGGYFIWIKLPAGLDGVKLRDFCIANHKIRFHPGSLFGTGLEGYIRLSISYYSHGDLAIGAQRLGEGIRAYMAVVASNGTAASSAAPSAAGASAPAGAVSIAVHGATGRLGSLIVQAAEGKTAGAPPAKLAGTIGRGDACVVPDGTQVVVDVSLPQGTEALIRLLHAHADKLASGPGGGTSTAPKPLPLVIGTTGDLPMDAIRSYAKRAPVVVCANFSVGVPLVLSLIEATKGQLPAGWHCEVTEIHHTAKKDAPSGTAKRLLAGLDAAGVTSAAEGQPIPAHALRLGDTVGVHTIHLAGPGERVEITHTATRREVFAIGAVRVASWALTQQPGLYIK